MKAKHINLQQIALDNLAARAGLETSRNRRKQEPVSGWVHLVLSLATMIAVALAAALATYLTAHR